MDRLGDLKRKRIAPEEMTVERLETSLGSILIVADRVGVRAIDFLDCVDRLGEISGDAAASLSAYFAGELLALDECFVRPASTLFQQSVRAALRAPPPGEAKTRGQLAARLGRPSARRAVGHANGANPICVVISRQRLTGADGSSTGYAGGLARKAWLLEHEAGRTPRFLRNRHRF